MFEKNIVVAVQKAIHALEMYHDFEAALHPSMGEVDEAIEHLYRALHVLHADEFSSDQSKAYRDACAYDEEHLS